MRNQLYYETEDYDLRRHEQEQEQRFQRQQEGQRLIMDLEAEIVELENRISDIRSQMYSIQQHYEL